MSKTARGCRARMVRALYQHPAILPWPSSPSLRPGKVLYTRDRQHVLPHQTQMALAIRSTCAAAAAHVLC